MRKGESLVQRAVFRFMVLFTCLVPPFGIFRRLENLCLSWLSKNAEGYTPRKVLAGLYKGEGMYEQAKIEYAVLQELGYLTEKGRVKFAEVLYNLKDYQGVVTLLASMDEMSPVLSQAIAYLGKSYMRMGMYEKGLGSLKQLTNYRKLKYEDHWDLGFCYSELHRHEEALEAYMNAMKLKPNTPELRENVAYVHCQRGQKILETDLAQAEKEFTKALQYWPDSQRALDGLAQVHALRQVLS